MVVEVLKYLKARYLTEKAQGMVEYALILAFVVVIAAFLTGNAGIGQAIQNVFQTVTNQLNTANQGANQGG